MKIDSLTGFKYLIFLLRQSFNNTNGQIFLIRQGLLSTSEVLNPGMSKVCIDILSRELVLMNI